MQKPLHTGNPLVLLQPLRNQRDEIDVNRVNVSRINAEKINEGPA